MASQGTPALKPTMAGAATTAVRDQTGKEDLNGIVNETLRSVELDFGEIILSLLQRARTPLQQSLIPRPTGCSTDASPPRSTRAGWPREAGIPQACAEASLPSRETSGATASPRATRRCLSPRRSLKQHLQQLVSPSTAARNPVRSPMACGKVMKPSWASSRAAAGRLPLRSRLAWPTIARSPRANQALR